MFFISSKKNTDLKFFQVIRAYEKALKCNVVLVENTKVGGRVEMPKKKKSLHLEKPKSYVFYMKYIVRNLLAFHDV